MRNYNIVRPSAWNSKDVPSFRSKCLLCTYQTIYYNKINTVYTTKENTIKQHSYLSPNVSANHPQRNNLHTLAGIQSFTLLATNTQNN